MSKKFLAVIVRCRDEPFIGEFVTHYLHEGADHIYLVDDNLESDFPETIYKNERITIVKAQSWKENFNHFEWSQMMDVNLLFEKIRSAYEWFISVDADEFITTKKHADRTIREELQQSFADVDCVKIPWVMMASGGREKDPDTLLTTLDHRWDHDKRHPSATWGKGQCRYEQIDVKCIFRPSNVAYISTHYPVATNGAVLNVVDGIRGEPTPLNYYHLGLRNADIETGYFLCYHYRVISRESAVRKIEKHTKLKSEGGYKAYSPEVIMEHDYAEILDETLKNKSLLRSKLSR